jgi:hypothetical protein
VGLDAEGKETLRIARRVLVAADPARAQEAASRALNFFSRVTLPATSQALTAVVADVQSESVGAARLAIDGSGAGPPRVLGLSLYSMDEKSLWIEIEQDKKAAAQEDRAAYTVGPALRSRFSPGENVRCGFKTPASFDQAAQDLRVAIMSGDKVVRVQPVGPGPSGDGPTQRPAGGTIAASLTLDGLEAGEYVLRVDEVATAGPSELARLPFRITAGP